MKKYGLPGAFIVSFFAVGAPYWLIPYNKINLSDALMGPGLFVVSFSALLLRSYGAPFWRLTAIIGGSVPAALFARVIADGMKDPTAHNLWPLEVIIAMLLGFVCAFAGSVAASLVVRLFPPRARVGES